VSARLALGWPSAGFYVLLGTHLGLVGMLLWGWQRPALDEAFEILTRRELDASAEFSPREVQLLQSCLDRHTGFGRALLGKGASRFLEPAESGWLSRREAHLTVRPEAGQPTQLTIEGRGEPRDFPIAVKLRGKGVERQVELSPNQRQKVEWSVADLSQPTIFNVEITPAKTHTSVAPSWAVRVESSAAARENP
jgi:hypothetical protein